MKMGTIAAPLRYDAAADQALRPDNPRRTAILRYAFGDAGVFFQPVHATRCLFDVCPLGAGRAESVRPRARTMRMTVPNSGLPQLR
jgi:hypothetical protein